MIDISLKLNKDNKVWEELKLKENKLFAAGHIGTHIDVPNKTEIPEEYIKTNGILIDCSNYEGDNEIDLSILENIEINENDFIIFKTNIQKENPYGSDIYMHNHNQLSWNLIDFLINKKVSFIGIDCAGIRRGKEHILADIKCEENKTYVIENLDLSKLNKTIKEKFNVLTIWINNPHSTGLATRVFIE